MVVATSATEVTGVYPPRALVSVTGMTAGQMIDVYRVVGGAMIPIRGGHLDATDTDTLVITDSEAPFGVPVFWRTRVNKNSPSYFDRDSSPLTITLPVNTARGQREVVLSDAITGNAAEVVITAWQSKRYEPDVTVYRVGGKNRIITGASLTGQFTADIRVRTFSRTSEMNLLNLIDTRTSGILQMRRSVSDGTLDECYFSVLSFDVERRSQDRTDGRRDFVMSIAETDGWPFKFTAKGFTYADLAAKYAGQTYVDLEADYATYLDLARADLS
ncbi:hypothetical protein AB0J83_41445 [Actinoplanes sp. NPDC049596]|uniref:hypothetical protein n=1 Tax=unclassified Actinoplanes TaxID=2626549 RepID=UPI003447FC97